MVFPPSGGPFVCGGGLSSRLCDGVKKKVLSRSLSVPCGAREAAEKNAKGNGPVRGKEIIQAEKSFYKSSKKGR
jgi:hypothetical protein